MTKLLRAAGALALALLVSGCFTVGALERVPEADLVLGSTTEAALTERLGAPRETSEETINDKTIRGLYYAYATSYTTDTVTEGLSVARAQWFYFSDGVLVGHQYRSTFASESTDFDESVVSDFREGITTRAEVLKALGPPTGRRAYPLVEKPEEDGFGYLYRLIDTRKRGFPVLRKDLVVVFGPDDVVRKITLTVRDDF